jgi:hypothetical protein
MKTANPAEVKGNFVFQEDVGFGGEKTRKLLNNKFQFLCSAYIIPIRIT